MIVYLCTVRLVDGHGAHHARALHLNALAVDDFKRGDAVFKHHRRLLAAIEGDGVDLALDLDNRVDALEAVQRLVHALCRDDDRLVADLTEMNDMGDREGRDKVRRTWWLGSTGKQKEGASREKKR